MAEKSKTSTPAKGKGKGKGEGAAPATVAESKGGKPVQEKLPADYVPGLLLKYRQEIVPALQKRFNYANPMQVPRLAKITINMGVGDAVDDQKYLDAAMSDLEIIAGQKPIVTRAKKSISNFKLRQNMAIGCMVTLRRWRMYEFLERFISIAVPRIRDFRGLPDKAFDGFGNYSIGVKEQIIFPEINYDKVTKIRGMNITFVTTAKTDEEAYELLSGFGMPFRRK
ncbi:MAG: 50S ribosomal protein L5 [candidate division KSB1 bacterium]|nr:50S ribosomal protein L5 [candidate division KSB1 bacterium]MDZ7272520.1 50S ribosomal protein L5 [candidate division KSB1 bacterium]MDZ7284456.1 50S ribosomal protein L5 [candidate division KSB1 bacterium]MDZ7297148.1 50S ribosomal protein L5 [candidate division KSB1 bacterium]MDZ7306713.1 50S ribosomal protein L5 [candidate division KSB1 bacterium]